MQPNHLGAVDLREGTLNNNEIHVLIVLSICYSYQKYALSPQALRFPIPDKWTYV